ncbi:MAG: cation:proton antiporter [Proteobacteria bacterium]|nr:cation:proton antiporter [Pseudomonadota bacterium]
MAHDATAFITTVAIAFVMAFTLGFIAQRLKLSPIVGYLLAGIAVGPYSPGVEIDVELATQLAEIGIILLMFGVGLHFSVKDLHAVRGIALLGAVLKTVLATMVGFAMARFLWDWSAGASLLFGVALSVASTVVLTRELEARHKLDSREGRITVGWLIIEDLIMVLALVLLPAIRGLLRAGDLPEADQLAPLAQMLALAIGKIAVFGAVVILVGRRVAPWVLGQVARTGSRELFTLSVLAIAFGIAYGSSELFGVSFALGAFFAGMVLNESDLSHQAAADSLPFQDAFAVLFFVSVGMLVDPNVVLAHPVWLAGAVLIAIAGKFLITFAIVLAFRYPIGTALMVSAGLAQIGEFSFILASLGVELKIMTREAQSLILATALVSISLNPFVFKLIGPLERGLSRWGWLTGLINRYAALPEIPKSEVPGGHTIIVGYGRVGSVIGAELARQERPFIVIEYDRVAADKLRQQGLSVVYGNAAAVAVLEAAHIATAGLLVIAAPDGFAAGHILTQARKIRPDIKVIARSHSAEQLAFLKRRGADFAVMGEHELAVVMAEHSLRELGVAEYVIDGVLKDLRRGETFSPVYKA